MDEAEETCEICGGAIPKDAPLGCPTCMLALGQNTESDDTHLLDGWFDDPDIGPSKQVGRYKLLERIGIGGMGEVYMAEQSEPIRRRVALKIIKLGMDTKQVVARFEAERQALAMMDHPNIARILDGGATEAGRPFFVMELVEGLPITQYCDEANLGLKERLELFIQVCRAIQHAHLKGIIHRDIKPSNVLVTQSDGVPLPKVIDFGIAKATGQSLTDKTMFTRFGQIIGTPEYMSPEQAEMSNQDVDTRSDIYSLGVLLYELLTGATPFGGEKLRSAALLEICRIIREEEPARPSTKISTLGEKLKLVASKRGTDASRLGKFVRGELDWVVMKTLEKDRSRRYDTVNALADDIQHFLGGVPVEAVPPSASYRLRKTFRRHQKSLTTAALLFVIMAAAAVISTKQAIRATEAEQTARAAEQEATRTAEVERQTRQESETVNAFLVDVFRSPDPERQGRDIKVAELLDKAAGELEKDFADQHETRARLQSTLANTYQSLGLFDEARALHQLSQQTFIKLYGANHPDSLAATLGLQQAYHAVGDVEQALNTAKEALSISGSLYGEDHPSTLSAMSRLALCHADSGEATEALDIRTRVLEKRRKLHGTEHAETIRATADLADSLTDAGRHSEAMSMREEVLAFRQKHLPEDHPDHLKALSRLALSKHAAGDHSEGVKIQENVLALSRKALGDSHPDTIALMLDLAVRYPIRHYGASALRKEALTLLTERYGEEHRFVLRAVESLADFCVATGAAKEAAPLAATALRLSRKIHGADSETTLNAIYRLAACEADENRLANAMTLTESALELNIKLNGRAHPRTTSTRASLAIYSHLLGSPARAVKLQEKVLRQTAEIHGTDSPQYLDAMSVMAYYKLAEGNHEEARDLQKNTLEKMSQVLPATASSQLMAIRGLAACYTVLGETEKRAILQSEFEKLQLADRKMLTFQPGVDNGHGAYDSTHYIRIQANAPHEQENHLEIAVQSKPKTQAMLRFGDIFGDKPGQIPLGSRIYSAKLSLTVNNSGVTPELYQMAGEWMSDKLTFSNFKLNGNDEPGVQLDGREAYAIPMVRAPHGQRGRIAINVTASVQNWADGERNLGWLFTVPQGTNAWGARNTTWTTPSERPALQVTFDPRETTPTSREDYRALATSRSRIGTALADDRQLLIVAMNRPQKPDTIDALTLIALQAWFDQAAALQYSRQSALARANTGRTTMNPAHPARILSMRPIDNAANQATVLQMARSGLQTAKRKRLNLSIYHLTLGMAEYRSGDYTAATTAFKAAIDNNDQHTENDLNQSFPEHAASFYYSMCLHHQGKHAEAAKLFNKTAVIMRSMPEDDFDVIHAKPNDMTLWLAYKEARTLLAAALAQPE